MQLAPVGALQFNTVWFILLAINFLQHDLICLDSDFWLIGTVKQLAYLYALR